MSDACDTSPTAKQYTFWASLKKRKVPSVTISAAPGPKDMNLIIFYGVRRLVMGVGGLYMFAKVLYTNT